MDSNLIYEIVNIYRTSPMNPNYPYGFDCKICDKLGIECTCENEGYECNDAYVDYFKREIDNRLVNKIK